MDDNKKNKDYNWISEYFYIQIVVNLEQTKDLK